MNSSYIPFFASIIGGLLSMIGGFFAVLIRVRVERKEEINFIKICLADELNEICTIVASMKDTYNKSPIIYAVDLNRLKENTTNFNDHRKRIYLITDEVLRKKVIKFYKDITLSIDESVQSISLSTTDASGNAKILAKMEALSSTASELNTGMKKYNYKAYWLF